jgi:hypothetical protein
MKIQLVSNININLWEVKKMNRHVKVFVLLTTLFGCTLMASAKSSDQPTIEDYSPGEKWVWKFKGITSEGVTRANGTDKKEIVSEGNKLYLASENGRTALSDVVKPDTSPTPRFSWPLKVGKTWKFEQGWTSQDGTQGLSSFDAEVLSFQNETVEAGSFMAYTIKYRGKITNSRGYSADTEEIFLYAPEVKNFIKLTQIQDDYIYEEELIEYAKP